MKFHDLLDVMGHLGKLMLENGAETYRVEDSIERVAKAYGVARVDVYAATTAIMITITTPDNRSLSRIKRIHKRSVNLDKVERLNRLCRETVSLTLDIDVVKETLKAINLRPDYSFIVDMLGYALTTSSFTLFFGGGLVDAAVSLFIGCVLKIVDTRLSKLGGNPFFITILDSASVSVLALLFLSIGAAHDLDAVIIGTIMPLVPGVALTNAVRDLMAGDLVAGQAKMTEAVLTATCIALGIGIPLSLGGTS
ncbi:MAG: threonine/serine exporter family protein [Turicibacter sp.]|nr:threonine/serine exporter family protein [Turicibacter sp.]